VALKLARRGVRAFEDDVNQYYRYLKGVDQDSTTLKLPPGGAFAVLDTVGATLFAVTPTATTFGGALAVDTTVTPPAGNGAWKLKTTGSLDTDWATSELGRAALLRLQDTNAASTTGVALLIDFIEDTSSTSGGFKSRTGIHVKGFTRLDLGESSCLLCVMSGGGSAFTSYCIAQLRAAGKTNYSYSPQGAAEIMTGNMSQALLLQSGFAYPETTAVPWPTLTSGILIGDVMAGAGTLAISDVTLVPTPGGAVPDAGLSGITTWPTPLYTRINGEVFSYTGKSVSSGPGTLTGVTRSVNTTAAAHTGGTKVEPLNAAHAAVIRLGTPVSKGVIFYPLDVSFDTRSALAIGLPVTGVRVDTGLVFDLQMNGNMPKVGAITSQSTISAATSLSSAQVNATNVSTASLFATADVSRRRAKSVGTALTATEIVLSSGWGTTRSVTGIAGGDDHFRFTVNSAGTGQAGAPTITITFKDGTFTNVPVATVMRMGGNQHSVNHEVTTTATTITITWGSTPVAGESYTFGVVVTGR
jgi:hypothetical protein